MSEFSFLQMKKKSVLLLCHENADLDSFCSAAIFQRILSKQKIVSKIAVPSHMNEQSIHFAFREKISFIKNPELCAFDFIFLFDFNDYEQLGKLRSSFLKLNRKKVSVFSFDHHVAEKRSIDSSKRFIGRAFSTTQVLLRFFPELFDKKSYFYCALGLIEDTGHFIVGNKKLFNDFALCLDKSKKEFSDVLFFTKQLVPKDERIAFLKAAQRAEITEVGSVVVVTSTVSFYQSQAASKLLDFGADISLVCGCDEKSNSCVLSCRADSVFKEKNKFNLVNDLLLPLQERIGGEIGGHSGAAQWKGTHDYLQVLQESIFILKKKFQ